MSFVDHLLNQPHLWALFEDDELSEDQILFKELMLNLEAYGTPLPCLYELPPKGGTTRV